MSNLEPMITMQDIADALRVNRETASALTRKYICYILASAKYPAPSDEAYEYGEQELERISDILYEFNN